MDQTTQRGALTVFVGNLPFSLGEEELKKMFSAYGAITAVTIVKDAMNRSKGYGFVEVSCSSLVVVVVVEEEVREVEEGGRLPSCLW